MSAEIKRNVIIKRADKHGSRRIGIGPCAARSFISAALLMISKYLPKILDGWHPGIKRRARRDDRPAGSNERNQRTCARGENAGHFAVALFMMRRMPC